MPMTTHLSAKEQKFVDMIDREKNSNPNWAENIYEDDDPHSEMLIKYIMWGIDENFPHYLNHVITEAPEHKLNVLGSFLLSGVVATYLNEPDNDYLTTLFNKFPDLLEKKDFWYGFCYRVHKSQNFSILLEMENKFDPELEKCRTHVSEEHKSIFEKYDFYKKLNGKFPEKNNSVKQHKI